MTNPLLIVIIVVSVIFGVIFLVLICTRLLRTYRTNSDNHLPSGVRSGERPLSVHTVHRTDNISQPGIQISCPGQDHDLEKEEGSDSASIPEMYYMSVGNDGTFQAAL